MVYGRFVATDFNPLMAYGRFVAVDFNLLMVYGRFVAVDFNLLMAHGHVVATDLLSVDQLVIFFNHTVIISILQKHNVPQKGR